MLRLAAIQLARLSIVFVLPKIDVPPDRNTHLSQNTHFVRLKNGTTLT